jgi:hypothetical protein
VAGFDAGGAAGKVSMQDYDITELDVFGYDAPVLNEFWAVRSDTLLVMLPGVGYTNQMPVMFYLHELAIARRWDILQVNYDYRGMSGTDEERLERLTVDCRAALDAALTEGRHTKVVLAGKSLGTIAMTTLLQAGIEPDVTALWLTPIVRRPEVREAMSVSAPTSAVAIGTRDDHYDREFLMELRAKGALVDVVEGADHSIDVQEGVGASIGVMRQVIEVLGGFLGGDVR